MGCPAIGTGKEAQDQDGQSDVAEERLGATDLFFMLADNHHLALIGPSNYQPANSLSHPYFAAYT
jgi:hypothetical protein